MTVIRLDSSWWDSKTGLKQFFSFSLDILVVLHNLLNQLEMLVNKQTQKQKSPHTKLFFPAFETLGEGHLKCPKIPQDNPLRLAESRLSFLRCQMASIWETWGLLRWNWMGVLLSSSIRIFGHIIFILKSDWVPIKY